MSPNIINSEAEKYDKNNKNPSSPMPCSLSCILSFDPKVATRGLNIHYNQRFSNAEWNEQHTLHFAKIRSIFGCISRPVDDANKRTFSANRMTGTPISISL